MYYNFCRIHQTLRVTPAMEAGVSDYVWSIRRVVVVFNWRKVDWAATQPGRPGLSHAIS